MERWSPWRLSTVKWFYHQPLEDEEPEVAEGEDEEDDRPVFNTAAGRPVYGGGGITPDVEIDPDYSLSVTQQKLLRFAKSVGLQTMAFSCLGSSSYVEIDMAKPEDSLMNYDLIKAIAEKHKKTPAQVLLRWGVQRGTTVIPKSVKPERQVENFALYDFELSEEDMKSIDGLDKNRRFNDPGVFAELAFGRFTPIYE